MRVYVDPTIKSFKCRACGIVFDKLVSSHSKSKYYYCPDCARLQRRYRYLSKKLDITPEELEEYSRLKETLKRLGINVK